VHNCVDILSSVGVAFLLLTFREEHKWYTSNCIICKTWRCFESDDVSDETTASVFTVEELGEVVGLCFADCFTLVACLAHTSILKMEAVGFSETSVNFTGLHDAISQKTILFALSAMRASDPCWRPMLISYKVACHRSWIRASASLRTREKQKHKNSTSTHVTSGGVICTRTGAGLHIISVHYYTYLAP
jgi:hypothetical protein